METKNISHFGIKFWVILAAIVIVIAGIKAAAGIITPLLLALFVTAICYGPFLWLKKKGLPELLALVVVVLATGILLTLFLGFIGTSISAFAEKLPFYEEKFQQHWSSINMWLVNAGIIDKNFGLDEHITPARIMSLTGEVFEGFGNLLGDSVLILLVVIFMLIESTLFIKKMNVIKPQSLLKIDEIINKLNKYTVTKTITSFATGVCITISLSIIGVDFPILWGTLAFLLNFIPNIGSAIAAIPAIMLALVQLGLPSAIITTVVYIAINGLIGNIIEPRLMGRNLGLSPLVVLISLIFWGWALGTVGMLLATPLTILLKITFDNMEETKHFGLMLGNETSLKRYEK
ncbi:MAG: AI-2E family transporter [Bacteroidetes bacterium]|nr:AI-2E family transporter [Bacteroidota bacterium]